MAQAFAVFRNDEELFTKIINEVIISDLDKKSDIYPEDYLEQQKAIVLKQDSENLFD